ncbi:MULTISPECIES: SDR family oxidoreductase [unclassified Mesorhizobium]|uniref:SDR family oxidoreductase n=1 Tax=unclassified Mesorhizobium TaxID=325217 RepID=UPI000BAF632B|nr:MULTISPECIES: SDR family oxidoreductase [unclassified Mesorhizobium]TGT60608.1 SDR family oxidoreductase [Mesorhizobium sp. M00.F.Ca.ET.170.01.1.1]AZO10291.1 SDR family oxidoreductase [Mesorhizobium sp. M3A.F.Ca.ET.080.04.2.1]PBB87819.1 short-chain dehydrogenase [Mesorhizobium sp. WSM3876]RWB73713.1 MAG: SDR family oxidoreductase [Mesorhizobium sp.]RWB91732.1 MAG: SDR family oxidoreductase [Mesorhizobium sp.]
MSGLAGRNSETRAIVTGGAQGVGFAVAEALADEGCRALALVGRSQEKGDKAVAALKKKGVDAIFISADVAKVANCKRAVAMALAHFGTVNALVNAAATSARGSLVETTEELFDQIFDTNVRGPFFLMQGLVAHLLERKAPGSIVNVLSMSAHAGQSFLTAYSTSKGALMTLTKNVASSHRRNRIRCNAVLPGWMDTEGEDIVQKKWHDAPDDWLAKAEAAQPMGQLVKPAQLARLITYMLSPQAGVMTGSLVDYDQNIAGVIGE